MLTALSSLLKGLLHCRSASPGKLTSFEDELFRNNENTEAPIIMAITLARPDNARTLGVAYCNVSTRHLGACEFVDSEQYCTLESVMLQLGAKEVVMPKARDAWFSRHLCVATLVVDHGLGDGNGVM